MNFDVQATLFHLAVAALGGLAVGIEREWSGGRPGEPARFGGVRTFLLLGLAGGLAAVLFRELDPRVGLLVLAAALGLVLIAYLVSAWRGNIDATSEVAGLLVVGAGAAAGFGMLILASAVTATTALVLVEKSRMHAAVARLESSGLEAGARFAVLALVVLPILPRGPIDRLGGIEPQKLWGIVLLFAGLSFAGYIALRLAGAERGYAIAGFLGGLVSSTAVTLNFARASRRDAADPKTAIALALGVVAACSVLPLRVLVLAAFLHAPVAKALAPALLLPFAAGAVVIGFSWLRSPQGTDGTVMPGNPLRLGLAIQMAAFFQIVLWLLSALRERVGGAGLLATSAVLGFTDMDALTYSLTQLAGGSTSAEVTGGTLTAEAAARGLVVGMIASTLFKAALALALGAAAFRLRVGVALAGIAGLLTLGLLWI
jgi:uncharacterized membrane protein (DUF4010 family)